MPLITADSHPSFEGIPPFPNSVPTAPLLRISLKKLVDGDRDELDKLWAACCNLGFFYLDLRDQELTTSSGDTNTTLNGPALLSLADELFSVGEGLFDLPLEEKRKYDHSPLGSYFGYKGYGVSTIDKAGNTDRNEFYNASKDQVLGVRGAPEDQPELAYPSYLRQHQPLLRNFMTRCHALAAALMHLLERPLGLPDGALGRLHRIDAAAGDHVRWVKARAQSEGDRRTALGAHTDFGSVTVLFNRVGGLQVRLPASVEPVPAAGEPGPPGQTVLAGAEEEEEEGGERWAYVRPLPGHAVVNLGDALVKFSAGVLRSNVHRVVSGPGAQAECTRYSVVYFARPEDDVLLRPLEESLLVRERMAGRKEEEAMNSRDWIRKRALGARRGVQGWKESRGTENDRLRRVDDS